MPYAAVGLSDFYFSFLVVQLTADFKVKARDFGRSLNFTPRPVLCSVYGLMLQRLEFSKHIS